MDEKTKWLKKMLLNVMRFGRYEPREYIIQPSKRIIYLNNPKVACTSIKVSLFDAHVRDDDTIHSILNNYQRNELYKQDYADYFMFTYVRNPFERLVSCYKNKVCEQKHYFDNYLGGYMENIDGFENFVNKIVLIPDMFADRHFQSQYALVYKHGRPVVDYIGKIEDIQFSYARIAKKYLLSELPHYNKTANTSWMDYYTITTANKVYQRYKKDFKIFKYDKYYYKLLNHLRKSSSVD